MEKDSQIKQYIIVQNVKKALISSRPFLSAVGDESRQLILIAILDGPLEGRRSIDIAAQAGLSRPAVSHHLKILKEAGIVKMRSEGKKNFYFIDFESPTVNKLSRLIDVPSDI